MSPEEFQWPTRDDYDLAMKDLQHSAVDPELRTGRVTHDSLGSIAHYGGANLYAAMYKVTTAPSRYNPSGDWMIRCFCSTANRKHPPKDIRERYQYISRFCLNHLDKVSALLPVTYVERGISVDYVDIDTETVTATKVLPLVKMPFISARSLGSFVAVYHQKAQVMERLCIAWLRMMRELELVQMAHGDLDLTNVLVVEEGTDLTLKLIDYDNVWIPTLSGRSQTEYGHEGFQHPAFMPPNPRPYNAEMDRFAALVIYISLRAIGLRPHFYKDWGADDTHRLLFALKDYAAETQETAESYYISRVTQLRQMGISVLTPYLDELSYALHNRCMPCSVHAVPLPFVSVIGDYVESLASQRVADRERAEAWGQGYATEPVAPGIPTPPSPPPVYAGRDGYEADPTDTSWGAQPPAQIGVARGTQRQSTAERGRSRIGCIVFIVVLLLLALVAALWYWHLGPFSPPQSYPGAFTHVLLLSGLLPVTGLVKRRCVERARQNVPYSTQRRFTSPTCYPDRR